MWRKLAVAAVAAVAAIGFVASAEAEPFKLKGDAKPAWIYFNVKNDGGWTQAIDEARGRIEGELGYKIPFVEKVPEVASEITPAAERYIQRGHNIIIGSAFGYSDAFKDLAARYPDVAFLNPAGTTNGPNLQSIYGRTYETQYLCGMVAGAISKSGKLGFVAANPFGLVNWTVNAYLIGARQTNPKAELTVIYTGAWNDPVKERAAAQALVEKGIDVIGQHVDTPTPQVVAQEAGIYGTGHHRDMREFAPKATACSSVWVWDQYMIPTLKKIAEGTWEPEPYGAFVHVGGGTDIACCGDMVPKEVAEKVMAERDAIIKGKHVFTGPIVDQSGKERIAAGATPSDGDLWGMDYLIQGVTGQLN